MRGNSIYDLIYEYETNRSAAALEELTRRIIFGELDESDACTLYCNKSLGSGIKQAVVRYSSREILIKLFIAENDEKYVDFIKSFLGSLTQNEAKTLLLDYKLERSKLVYAVEYADLNTLVEYVKKEGDKLIVEKCIFDRLIKLEASTNVADELLFSTNKTDILIFALNRASKKALLEYKLNFEIREKCLPKNLADRINVRLLDGDLTNEEADIILNEIKHYGLIRYAIRFASKKTLLMFYPSQSDEIIVEDCLKRLKELIQA